MIFDRDGLFWTDEHRAFRDSARRFVDREIAPFAEDWDEAGAFPRDLYRKAGAAGLLGLGFAEEFGGVPGDRTMKLILGQEMARPGAGGVAASLFSHTIGAPPIALAGSAGLKRRVLPAILAGDMISALLIWGDAKLGNCVYADDGRHTDDAYAFCFELLEAAGVAITPGIDFGAHEAATHVRFAYTTGLDRIELALERLRRFLGR